MRENIAPTLKSIDHVHIHVSNRELSERWYKQVLGLHRDKKLEFWANDGGPLTITNSDSSIHLALFESESNQRTVVAFAVSGQEYIKWYSHLRNAGLQVKHNNHEVSWSVYFKDPNDNPYEITTYDYEFVTQALVNSKNEA
ncbi:MAG: VOC family protein [Pseudomonadota bacterium]